MMNELKLCLLYQSAIPGNPSSYLVASGNHDDFYPVDFLEGCMDMRVVMPSKRIVRMDVERRTPMLDLLVQGCKFNAIWPSSVLLLNQMPTIPLY